MSFFSLAVRKGSGLDFSDFYFSVEKVMVGEQWDELQHSLHVIAVMQNQQFVEIFGGILHIGVIDIDQLTAVIFIFSVDTEKCLQRFLLTVRRI